VYASTVGDVRTPLLQKIMKVVLIDGDMIAYYSCPPRKPKGKDLVSLEDKEELDPEEKAAQDTAYLNAALKNFRAIIDKIVETAFADDALVAVKSDSNFRDDIYDDYKGHRNRIPEEMKNKFVPIIRRMAVHQGLAIEARYREADDMLRIWEREAVAAGHEVVISSGDKDIDCIPGIHVHAKTYNIRKLTPEYSMRFYYEQLLKGDPTDNIPGIPDIGPVKAVKMLADCETEDDFRFMVASYYKELIGEDWRNYLLSNGKMIHLQAHEHDWFEITSWGVD